MTKEICLCILMVNLGAGFEDISSPSVADIDKENIGMKGQSDASEGTVPETQR